ncbi:MAG: hypothetical protein IPK27_17220 [Rhodanobacteraceae bacterium]|nr:hypothetical protein [Rhodanobacteraceae bacterium]
MLLASRVLYALDEHGRGGILLHDLAEDLNGGWKYDPGLIQAVCDLLESHLCMLTIDAGEPSNGDGFSRRLIITAHGHNLIHNHARDPAYLHLCALRIPISREIVRLNLLQIARLESVDWGQKVVKCGVTSWIEAKIRNAIFLAVLTQAWCEGDPPTGSKAYIFRAHDAMNRAFGDRVSYVLIQLSKALDQLDVRERRAILGALSRSVEAIKESDYASRP